MILIDISLLEKISYCLDCMIGYADDGTLNKNDPDFEYFFKKVDEAKRTLQELNEMVWETRKN